MNELVTVIVPVAEAHLQYLPNALRSLQNQTVQTHKIIVVNDSGKSLRVNAGSIVMNTTGHRGTAFARNLALERVQTPFVVFLDSDDLMVNTAIETMLRAYASYREACYIYGDAWYQPSNEDAWYYKAPLYNRSMLLGNYNLHNVTALLPTRIAKAVGGFDEVIRGWEDWDFYIRLALAGYCGTKVPSPFILYNLGTGVNRANHNKIGDEIIASVRERYHDYMEGTKPLMGCGCSDDEARKIARAFVDGLPAQQQINGVLMEYLGRNEGEIPFKVNGNTYRGANNASSRFVQVKAEDVTRLLALNVWRLVPLSAETKKPSPQDDVIVARKQVDPVAVTIPRMETATQLAAKVTQPVFDPDEIAKTVAAVEPKLCECGHIALFHSEQGCQALVGDKACGCKQFTETEVKESHAEPNQRSRARARKASRNTRPVSTTD